MDVDELSRKTKVDKRALMRLEVGDSLPTDNSYTLNKVMEVLEMNRKKRMAVKAFAKAYKDLENIVRMLDK